LAPVASIWVDAVTFESAATAAVRATLAEPCQSALDLYAGELLPDDRYEPWAAERRDALRATAARLRLELANRLEAAGPPLPRHRDAAALHPAALGVLQAAIADDPVAEGAHRSLMRLYVATGQLQLALRQFQHLADALQRELATEPEAATRQLYRRILVGQA